MPQTTNPLDQKKWPTKPAPDVGMMGAAMMAGGAISKGTRAKEELEDEPSLISRIMSGAGKVAASIGKGLAEPGVPEMLARMGVAFGTSPSGIPGAGARVGQQFIDLQETQRQAETQAATRELAGRQVTVQEKRVDIAAEALEIDRMVATAKTQGQVIIDPVIQQRMYETQRRVTREQVYSSMPGDLITTTDPETGAKRTEWVPHDPVKAQALIEEEMLKFTDRMISLNVWPKEHMYSTPVQEEAPVEEEGPSPTPAAKMDIGAVFGGQEQRLVLEPGPVSIGLEFAPTITAPAGATKVAQKAMLPPLKNPGQKNSEGNPFIIGSTDKDLANVSNLQAGDYALYEGRLYIVTGPDSWEVVK